ncbi:MAG: 2-oxo acid dehydrogenase subunit E2 [Planctomycetes bacterium]|nr:2-oxo acid dehydrogenase subunit E2 [Planctomycetota bacterium]MCK5473287.1 2-oxo acid dehydrogenase subunit E2 [Planctomycetota bacterium]
MATEIKLPLLGKTTNEATVVGFAVKVGDYIQKGQNVFEVETDKVCLEIESPASGFVKCIIAKEGQTLKTDDVVMLLGEKDETISQSIIDSLKAKIAKNAAEKPALEMSSDKSAVEMQIASQIRSGEKMAVSKLQKITAEKMLFSKRNIPCFYLTVRVDVTEIIELREELNKTGKPKISYNDFIMRALATGLEKFPIMTGQTDGNAIILADSIGIGLSVAVDDGLVAPVLKDVNKKTITQIAGENKKLIEKARSNNLTLEDLEGGCITVSNLGSFGIDWFIPIVVPGQASIVGIGCIKDVVLPERADNVVVRKMMNITLSVDHRITNGAYAAQFLDFVRKQLEDKNNFIE